MKANERLIAALNQAIEDQPDIEIGKFIRYISSVSDLAYMTDDDLANQIEMLHNIFEADKEVYERNGGEPPKYEFTATEVNYFDESYSPEFPESELYVFSKENEQIAYDRYKERVKNRIFFEFEERLDCSDFLKRLGLSFVRAGYYKGITVINHKDDFLIDFPMSYRHMHAYSIYKKDDEYIAKHRYAVKNPDFEELFENIAFQDCKDYDECFSIAIDRAESPRFTDYTNHIMYGVCTRAAGREVEIYNQNQTIEIFHELMQKSNKIMSDWDALFYGDGLSVDGYYD